MTAQLIHICTNCGHTWQSDYCCEFCLQCGGGDVLNEVNQDAPAINDTRSGFLIETSIDNE
jgi:predicted  nucleic acid-binding Zn-ribbon protein